MSQTEMFLKLFEEAAPQVKLNTEITDAASDKKPEVPGPAKTVDSVPKTIPFADKITEIAKAHGWEISGAEEHEAAVKMSAESNGKLSYDQALSLVYSQKESKK